MDDVTLMAKLASGETVYVSPVHDATYAEYVEADNLERSAFRLNSTRIERSRYRGVIGEFC